MKVCIIAIGQKMPAWAQTAFEDYAKRMPPEWKFECKALKAEARGSTSTAKIMQAEAERIAQERRAVRHALSAVRTLAAAFRRTAFLARRRAAHSTSIATP